MNILAIESSCDETAAAIVADGRRIRSNVVASQSELHAETGGVVPEVAARAHLQLLVPVIRQALRDAECDWDDLDAIAATAGPGLPGALLVGLNAARGAAFARGLPFIAVDHVEGHVRANWLREDAPPLPALALVVSGGHTELLLMTEDGAFQRLGGTRDDAAGEAFDKVARLLGLGYPGGPLVSRLALEATDRTFRLPRAWLGGSDDFSFSGLKSAVLRTVRGGRCSAVRRGGLGVRGVGRGRAVEEDGADRGAGGGGLAARWRWGRGEPPHSRARRGAIAGSGVHPAAGAVHRQRGDDRRGGSGARRSGAAPGGGDRHRSDAVPLEGASLSASVSLARR